MNKNFNEVIIDYLKTYGFIIPNSEIYGGLVNAWDYGHLGILVKNNLQNLWWKYFVLMDDLVYGMDSSIILNSKVWETSGHLDNFSDFLIDCKNCKSRFRADHFLEKFNYLGVEKKTPLEIDQLIASDLKIKCLKCEKREFTNVRKFNLMFSTEGSVTENQHSKSYLRPETAQTIFINYKSVQRTMRTKLPFAIGQVGKAFRNEVTVSNGIFRTKEFEQMELEWFCHPSEADKLFESQLEKILFFLKKYVGLNPDNLCIKEIPKDELAHYSSRTVDIDFKFAHGWGELWGLANRTDFDLKRHQSASKQALTYYDEESKQHLIPYVIEPSVGLNRLMYALITNGYYEDKVNEQETRIVLKLPFYLAAYNVAILPLTKTQFEVAKIIKQDLVISGLSVNSDFSGTIGKRYRRNDAIGTPYCITCDFETFGENLQNLDDFTLENCLVTIRNRDTMQQLQLKYSEIKSFLIEQLNPFVPKKLFLNWK